jgi:hypothetical protein
VALELRAIGNRKKCSDEFHRAYDGAPQGGSVAIQVIRNLVLENSHQDE